MEKKINIGKTDLKMSPFVLGGNVFGWTADARTSYKILDQFTGKGFEHIDTANSYSHWAEGNVGGESEEIIGNWLKKRGKRNDVIIATKVGGQLPDREYGLKADLIRQEVEMSLKRLQTDYIDLYYTHFDDLDTPIEETIATYSDLIKEGKIRYIATSNMSPDRIMESIEYSRNHDLPEYIALQPEYNLYKRKDYEQDFQALATEQNLAVMPYFTLAAGFLTAKYKTVVEMRQSARAAHLDGFANERGDRILKALTTIANEYNATEAQIALAWLLSNPSITAPIASVSKPKQLDILKCIDIELSQEAKNLLNEASAYDNML